MSTDDLTARVRDHLAHADSLPRGLAISLVSELADEVDRLRAREVLHGEAAETSRRIEDGQLQRIIQVEAERDAARAALGRVTELLTLWARLASQQANLGDVVLDLTRALEGES
ncbi:hypothetical protein [Oerskovia paurometabola]|uniref:hypothetical protein n=1 Tax=Oerskovia paurometabola TaxID=162170 RepID=UPI00380AA6D0